MTALKDMQYNMSLKKLILLVNKRLHLFEFTVTLKYYYNKQFSILIYF